MVLYVAVVSCVATYTNSNGYRLLGTKPLNTEIRHAFT